MIKNILLISIRSMAKNKLFIFINLVGMSIAIGCCIVGYFAYEYDRSFNIMHKSGNAIYRVSSNRIFNNEVNTFGIAPLALGKVVRDGIKDVDKSARFHFSSSDLKNDQDVFATRLAYVDPAFFQMFAFVFVAGSGNELDKSSVIVTKAMAIRLFGSAEAAYDKIITQVYGTELRAAKITGVIEDLPQNSSFHNKDVFMNFENMKDEFKDKQDNDWSKEVTLFVQINNSDRVSVVSQQLQRFVENNNTVRQDFQIKEFILDSFPEMARNDRDSLVKIWTWSAPPKAAIVGSSVMGLMILLIACFNLTNTAIAISSRRLKEIGIRKVMGGMRSQLIYQFLGETTLMCLIALVFGVLISIFLVDSWNTMWEYMQLKPHYDPGFLAFLVCMLLFVGLIAGGYPAFYISKFDPVRILKGTVKFGGTSWFTRSLLVGQFSISLIAILSAIAFYQNAKYQKNYDLGFNVRGSAIAWLNNSDEVQSYRNTLEWHRKIIMTAGAKSGIYSNRAHEPVKFESKELEIDVIEVGDNYLKAMNLNLTAGRDFMKDSESDRQESIIISEGMAREFGLRNPLSKEFVYHDSVKLYVVGVVKDIYTNGLWRERQPVMIRYIGPESYTQLVVSAAPSDSKEVITFMETRWKDLFPYRLFNGRLLSVGFTQVEEINRNILVMYSFLGVVAMFLSATGLFTLVSLNIIKRMKEIGVRKVLGASPINITRIINAEFFVLLLVSSVIGCWMGYFSVNALMGSIWKYYQASNAQTFVFSLLLMFSISITVVGYKIFSAASTNPVNTLREE